MKTVTRTNYTKLGTVVFDYYEKGFSEKRALVYKVGGKWVCRVGYPVNTCVTGIRSGGVSCGYSTRKAAEAYAVQVLGGE